MGEARRKRDGKAGGFDGPVVETNGHLKPVAHAAKQVRLVPNIKLQTVAADGVVVMMVGGDFPELAVALAPGKAKELIEALMRHLAELERSTRRIILPGELP